MTDLSLARLDQAARRTAAPIRPAVLRALLYAAVGGATLAGLAAGRMAAGDGAAFDDKLVLLLRFMAAIKMAGVVGAAVLTHWRFRRAIAPPLALGYVGALALMTAAPGLIVFLAHIGLAALLFHAGLLSFFVLALRDDAVLPARLRGQS